MDCPLDCEYLLESRLHERLPETDPAGFPNQDIQVTESFLREHEPLLLFLANALLRRTLSVPGAIDNDVREALDTLIRTYRTLQSGLVYESKPQNPIAAAIHEGMQASVAELRESLAQRTGTANIRDAEVLGIIVFLQRLEIQHNNGRRRGRAFLDFLARYFLPATPGAEQTPAGSSSLILP